LANFPEPEHPTWDENFDALHWFRSNLTQFVYNGFGATGFNYAIAYRDFDDMGLSGDQLDEWKWKLKVMESEALYHMNKKPA
jgi:hypothetical protein